MSTALKVVRLAIKGQCPVFNRNAQYHICMVRRAKGKNCSLCDFTRALPQAGRKLILRFWLAKCSDVDLLAIVHDIHAAGY